MNSDWDETFMRIAELVAARSHCVKYKVGAILVKDRRILSIGCNGTPKGMINCDEVFSPAQMLNPEYRKKHSEFAAKMEIHAEVNCLIFAGQYMNKPAFEDAVMYVTLSPCKDCVKTLMAAGIKKVYYRNRYKHASDEDYSDLPIQIEQLPLT